MNQANSQQIHPESAVIDCFAALIADIAVPPVRKPATVIKMKVPLRKVHPPNATKAKVCSI